MAFNYRVVKRESSSPTQCYTWYEVLEVFYNKDGIPHSSGESHNLLYGEEIKDLAGVLDYIKEAFNKPVLQWNQEQQQYVEVDE